MPLPFYILMGDHEPYLHVLDSDENTDPQMILEDKHWTLVRVADQGLYWIIGEEVTDLVHQFMSFRTARIIIFINYRQQNPLEKLEIWWRQIQALDSKKIEQIQLFGVNFHPKLIKRKAEILKWCINHDSLAYLDWNEEMGWDLLSDELEPQPEPRQEQEQTD